jgi:hypothetical protein
VAAGPRETAQLIIKIVFAYQMCRNVVSGRPFAVGMFEHDRRQVALLAQILHLRS